MRLVPSLRWPTSGAHEITLGKTLIFVPLGSTKVNWSLDGIANVVNEIVASPLRTRAPPAERLTDTTSASWRVSRALGATFLRYYAP
jgi:hypothetical protein